MIKTNKITDNKFFSAVKNFYSTHLIRKIFLTLVIVVLLVVAICMIPVLGVKAEKLPEVSATELLAQGDSISIDEGRILVASSEGKELYLITDSMTIEVVDTETGKSFSSAAAGGVNGSELALLSVMYLGEDNNLYEWNSYDNCTVFGSYEMFHIDNGVRIQLNFNEGESNRFYEYMPKKMSIDEYENFFKAGIEGLRDNGTITEAQASKYLMTLSLVYKKSVMEECYAVTYTGTPPVSAVNQMLEVAKLLNYTEEMLLADADAFDFTVTFTEPANFDVTVEVMLEDGELVVHMPASEMVTNNDYYTIQNVKLMPNFGAVGAGDYEEGYILVPDGTGALFDFNSYQPSVKDYERPIYDNDFYKDYYYMPEYAEELFMPVYGMTYGQDENSEKGFLAIIESGAQNAYMNVKLAGTAEGSSKYNKAYASFDINQYMRVKIFGRYSTTSSNYLVDTGMQNYDCTVRYILYNDTVTYYDMAQDYKEYLAEQMGKTIAYDQGDASLYLEFIGAITLQKRLIGIPYKSVQSMTTYNELLEIMEDLEGMEYIVQYDGVFNKGIDSELNVSADTVSANGSKKQLQNLMNYADTNAVDMYMSVAFSRVSDDGNGYMESLHAVRDFANEEVTMYRYVAALGVLRGDVYEGIEHIGYNILSPKYLSYVVESFLQDSDSYKNLAITDLAGMYYADYRFDGMITGNQGDAIIKENLEKLAAEKNLVLKNPHIDQIGYGSIAVDISRESSDYATFSKTVPFKQLVMNGLIHYTTEDVNIASKNPAYFVLQAAELGAYPKYILTSKTVTDLKNTDYHYLFSAEYNTLKEDIRSVYETCSEIRSAIGTSEITNHVCLMPNVYETTYATGVRVVVNYNLYDVELEDGTKIAAEDYLIKEAK